MHAPTGSRTRDLIAYIGWLLVCLSGMVYTQLIACMYLPKKGWSVDYNIQGIDRFVDVCLYLQIFETVVY